MFGWRAKLGIAIPSANAAMEPEFNKMAPVGVAVFATRMWFTAVTEEEVNALINYAADAGKVLKHAGVDVLGFGCTVGSMVKGKAYDQEVAARMTEATGLPVVVTATAVVDALKSLEVKRLSVVTPYPDWANPKIRQFLEEHGFEVRSIKGLNCTGPDISDIPPERTYRFAVSSCKEGSQALFISCTGFRSIEVLEHLENDLGIPVISSNQATFWKMLRVAGIRDRIAGYGRLLRDF